MEHSLTGTLWRLAAVLALVFANGFFVAAEFAIVKVRKTRVDQMIAEGNRGARAVRRAVNDPDSYIAATQLGITMASLGLGWIGEPALAGLILPTLAFAPANIAETTAHSISVAVAFAIVTALHITLGELAPKSIALERAEATALVVVKPTELFMRAFWPFIRLLNGMGQSVVRLIGLHGSGEHAAVHSEEELKMLVTASQEAGVIEQGQEQMLRRVFGFAELTAGEVMVPRTELAAVPAHASGDELLQHFSRTGYATLCVYRDDLDNMVGMLHAIDVIKTLAAGHTKADAVSMARETLTVPETMSAGDLVEAMRQGGVREALVIDEYGGTAGLVTFQWLMERIVGVVGNKARDRQTSVHADGSADVDGLTLVRDVNDEFGLHVDDETFTTLGGYVMGRIGRPARVGDTVEVEDRQLRVVALDGLRVARVWVSPPLVGSHQSQGVGDDDD